MQKNAGIALKDSSTEFVGRNRWSIASTPEAQRQNRAGESISDSTWDPPPPPETATRARIVLLSRWADTAVGLVLFNICLILAAAHPLAGDTFPAGLSQVSMRGAVLVALFAATWHGSFVLAGVYDGEGIDARTQFVRTFAATTMVSGLMLFAALLEPVPLVPAVVLFWATAIVMTACARIIVRARVRSAGRTRSRAVVVVGTGPRARRLVHELRSHPRSFDHIVGFLDRPSSLAVPQWVRRMQLGEMDRLEPLLMKGGIDEVVIALPIRSCYEDIRETIHTCERMGVDCRFPADLFETALSTARVEPAPPRAMINMRIVPTGYRVHLKRAIDVVAASALLVLLAPVFLAIAIAIRLDSPGPILFRQERYGFRRRRFRMWKFRSMVAEAPRLHAQLEDLNEASGPMFKIRDDPRITRVGRILRRTSLDELPQLFNVFRGEMSLVGPRPLSLRDVGRFDDGALMRRFSVLPGITGLWQVSGRSDSSFERMIALDLQYIDEWSFPLELRILFMTIGAVIERRGAC